MQNVENHVTIKGLVKVTQLLIGKFQRVGIREILQCLTLVNFVSWKLNALVDLYVYYVAEFENEG